MFPQNLSSRLWRSVGGLAAVRGSLIGALVLVFFDIVLFGSYLHSTLICPIWFLASVTRAIIRPPALGVAIARVMIPVVTGILVFVNYSAQRSIAKSNAARVIQACERYRDANNAYPENLSQLVPRYLSSVPPAKYCLCFGEFWYWKSSSRPGAMLIWYEIPPFGRRIYSFERGTWSYLD